ncbi:MAG: hypothetical protein Q9227_005572 [Pyrenula ochraceoflavens]
MDDIANDGSTTTSAALTTVTASQSDTTVTGTYALETIASYSKLRQSLTTTITAQPQPSDPTGAKTAVAIVLAGGVCWFLAGYLGDAVAAETLLEEPAEADGHDDDEECPVPENKCSECNGDDTLRMCFSTDAAFCACEPDHECPSEEPLCVDPNCNGQNGKCTTGDLEDCDCKACPTDPEPECSDSNDCQGEDDSLILKCSGGDFHDCDCLPSEEGDPPYTPFGNQLPHWSGDYDLPPISPGSYSRDPIDYTCQNSYYDAPKDPSQNKTLSVKNEINHWCESVDGKTVDEDRVYKMFKYDYYAFWLYAKIWEDAPKDHGCKDEAKMSKSDCIYALTAGMKTCDGKSKMTHGVAAEYKCLQYVCFAA